MFWFVSPERTCRFFYSYGKINISNCAIRSLGLRIRSLESDNSFSRIAIRSSNKAIRSLGMQFGPSIYSIRFPGLQFVASILTSNNPRERIANP